MKYTYAAFLFVFLSFPLTAQADCGSDLNAQKTYDCIVAEASKDVEIELAPGEGNSQMDWMLWASNPNCGNDLNAQQTYDCIVAEASKGVEIELAPSEGNSRMNWMLWKEL